MEPLRVRLRPHAVVRALDLQAAQRGRDVDAAVRVDVDLPAQPGPQLQLDAARRRAVVVRLSGLADGAGEGERVGEAAAGGLNALAGGLERRGGGWLRGPAAADVESVEDLVDGLVHVGLFLGFGLGFGGGRGAEGGGFLLGGGLLLAGRCGGSGL